MSDRRSRIEDRTEPRSAFVPTVTDPRRSDVMMSRGRKSYAREAAPGPGSAAALSWDAVVVRYARLVYSIPVRFGLSRHDADDVFQATFLTAVRRQPEPPPPDRIVRWLAAIASWETRNLLRKRAPRTHDPRECKALDVGETPPDLLLETEEVVQLG